MYWDKKRGPKAPTFFKPNKQTRIIFFVMLPLQRSRPLGQKTGIHELLYPLPKQKQGAQEL